MAASTQAAASAPGQLSPGLGSGPPSTFCRLCRWPPAGRGPSLLQRLAFKVVSTLGMLPRVPHTCLYRFSAECPAAGCAVSRPTPHPGPAAAPAAPRAAAAAPPPAAARHPCPWGGEEEGDGLQRGCAARSCVCSLGGGAGGCTTTPLMHPQCLHSCGAVRPERRAACVAPQPNHRLAARRRRCGPSPPTTS